MPAKKPLSERPEASSIADADLFMIVQGGITKKVPASVVESAIGGGGGGGGTGDVEGPASATDNAVVRFNLTTGKLIQNSTVIIDDTGNLTAPRLLVVPASIAYDLAANVLAVGQIISHAANVSVATGKIYNHIRFSKTDGGYNIFVIAENAQVDGFNIQVQAESTSHATSILHAGVGVASNKGPGSAKGLYGRAIAEAGCTGTVVGIVAACEAISGVTGWGIQVELTDNVDAAAYIHPKLTTADLADGIVFDSDVRVESGGAFLKAFQTAAHTGYFLKYLSQAAAVLFGVDSLGNLAAVGGAFSADVTVPDEAYGVGWNGSLEVPTKNALYDKIETLAAGGGGISDTFTWNPGSLLNGAIEVETFTLTGVVVGDIVSPSFSVALPDGVFLVVPQVTAADTVKAILVNLSGATQDVGSGTLTLATGVASAGGDTLPIVDTTAIVKGSGDATKLLRIEADGITTATTRVWTAPDANTTIPIISQILTFTGPTAARSYALPDEACDIGFRNIPQNSKSADYTTVLADAGKRIYHPSSDNNPRTFTIAANASVAYPIGTVIGFGNRINTITIAIASDTLMMVGTGTTGSRTLAPHGFAVAEKVSATEWYIAGEGLS